MLYCSFFGLLGFPQEGHLLPPRLALQLLHMCALHFGQAQNGPMGGEQVLAILAWQVSF